MADKDKPVPCTKINITKAIANWEADDRNEGKKLADQEVVDLIFRSIDNLDTSINTLTNCRFLSLSSNLIIRIPELNLPRLERLSLGRNRIKKISGLSFVSPTLKELWISYNEITTLEGIKECTKLEVLYIGNNLIGSINELNVIAQLDQIQHAVFKNNPFVLDGGNVLKPVEKPYTETIPEITKKIPSLITYDGELCATYILKDEQHD
jgi:dynein light chain 1